MAVVISTSIQTRFSTGLEVGTGNAVGVAPHMVQVRANVTTSTDDAVPIPYPYFAIHFLWDFGDGSAQSETVIEPVRNRTVRTNNQIGRQAAHVYKNAGDYTITLRTFYFQPSSQTWVEGTPATTTVKVRTPSNVQGWDTVYFDPDATTTDDTGLIGAPLRTLTQLRAAILNRDNVFVYLAAGAVITPSGNEDVLTFKDNVGVRFGKYTPNGSVKTANPKIQLHSSATNKACIRVTPDKAANQQSDVQNVYLANAASGSFTLSFRGATTSAIAYNANAATVQSELQALSTIGASNATVTGSGTVGSPFVVTFAAALANLPQPTISADGGLLTGTGAKVVVKRVTNGSANNNHVQDVLISDVDLDGNVTSGSRGISVDPVSTTEGRTIDFYFRNGTIDNTVSHCVYISPTIEASGSDGPEGVGLWNCRANHTAAGSTGHNLYLAATKWLLLVACGIRGGNGSSANDHAVYVPQFGTSTLQQQVNFRWNSTAPLSGVSLKNFAFFFSAGVRDVTFIGNNVTGTRNGICIDKTTADPVGWPMDYTIEGNAIHNMGIAAADEARGLVLRKVTQVMVRNNLLYENGHDQTTTVGADIDIPDITDDPSAEPIFIYHNSFFRSYGCCGAPHIKMDDYRYVQLRNNAFAWMGIPSGTDGHRSILYATSSSYVVTTRNEVQKLTFSGTPTSGTFVLNYGVGSPTATSALAFNASAATIQTALEALGDIAPGDVVVTSDGATGPWTITFQGALAQTNVSAITVSNNTTGVTLAISTVVDGGVGRFFSNGNIFYAPNLIRSGSVQPFRVGANFIPFASDAALTADWRNGGSTLGAPDVFDVLGTYGDPSFRNPEAGNLDFGFGDLPVDFEVDAAARVGVRFDYRGTLRLGIPDAGAFEYDGTSSDVYSYQPAPLVDLPTARGTAYFGGEVRYYEAHEPALATGDDATDIDNRPLRHLAFRDNRIGESLDGMLADVNSAFCSAPQLGSAFTAPHTSMKSFIDVGHYPDGTLKLTGLDLSTLGFLRIDGQNSMQATLNFGNNRGINAGAAVASTDVPQFGQTITVYVPDTKWSQLTMGPHKWDNGVGGADPGYAAHTSYPTGTGSPNNYAADGHAINMSAAPDVYALANPASAPYFDGRYIRDVGGALLNTHQITQDCGNSIFNLAYPTRGHHAVNKQYVDDLFAQVFVPAPPVIEQIIGSNFTLPREITLSPGTWMVYVSLLANEGGPANHTCTVASNAGAQTRTFPDVYRQNQVTFPFAMVVTAGGSYPNKIAITALGAMYAQGFIICVKVAN